MKQKIIQGPFKREKKNLRQLLDWVENLHGETTLRHVLKPKDAMTADWPDISPVIIDAMKKRGISRPYTHQAHAISLALKGKHLVVVTPTASGKTLCYNVPVIDKIIGDSAARALYLFPTKALAQDQLAELSELIDEMKLGIRAFTYDGDTPGDARTKIRNAGHVIVSNPDMLHTAILPHHTKWKNLFENLKYVVIDELHTYRGIFGSHLALILQRLLRICEFYGSNPTFICCSATISNPKEHAERLTEKEVELIDENGAPASERHILFYNPPLVNRQLGIRANSLKETTKIAAEAVASGVRTIVFTRSRINVELILTYLQEAAAKRGIDSSCIAGYRGGYLPGERRAIEQGLRNGSIRCVVSTNALELGVDIGSLELALLHGYPGSVASAWQQIGRAGRRAGDDNLSAAIMVASSLSLDQFLVGRPSYFFGASPEHARVNPENPFIMAGHVKCSAFELPFREPERLGGFDVLEVLEFLAEHGVIHEHRGAYHWQDDSYPAGSLSLRSATSENYVIHDVTDPAKSHVIGKMDRKSAPTLIFPQAIYFHLGEPYQVQELDHERMRCDVKKVNVDYYTDGDAAARIEVLEEFGEHSPYGWGEILLATRPTIYKKIKLHSNENVGYGNIHLPEEQMHTTAFWIHLPDCLKAENQDPLFRGEGGENALLGMANLLRSIAPLFLMCDRGDLIVNAHRRDPHFKVPVIFLADNVPGGVGLAEALFELGDDLLKACLEALGDCKCSGGCPACIGAQFDEKGAGKLVTAELLRRSRARSWSTTTYKSP